MNKLITNKTPEVASTTGIDILKWKFLNADGDLIRLNAWDFGGQEIYHSTHQFFLTKRSLYLFVWEARKDENMINFDYWLNIIQILSGSSPTIVVMNKSDERVKEIDEKSLREKFPNIQQFIQVSAELGHNIDRLKEAIIEQVLVLPHINDKLPEAWGKIRAKLESINDDYISYEDYKSICNGFGLSKEQSKYVSRYFHDLGVIIHFSDNPILKPVVFLNPQWVTNCVYDILELKSVITNHGLFSPDLLEDKIMGYDSQQISYVIELMRKFELCLKLSNTKYIIPELLKPSYPDKLDIQINNGIGIVYKYDFMPAGIVPRLIVRLKNSIYEDYYWKNGVYLKHEDSYALIESNQFIREIRINVNGDDKALLLGIIKKELDHINSTLNYPIHKVEVMCCCVKCKKDENPFMFDYKYLTKAKLKNFEYVHCQTHLVDVNLSTLIGPYEVFNVEDKEMFSLNEKSLLYDLIEISSRVLERKFTTPLEDIITDNYTDGLRFKGYSVTDQTRSGRSKINSGELDIMVRDSRQMPISIIEAFRLNSFSDNNRTIIEHINKLLIDYDTNDLKVNYILIYSLAENFQEAWIKYVKYIKNLPEHDLYDDNAELISYAPKKELSKRRNIKILTTQHSRSEEPKEIHHIFINFHSGK